MLPKRIKVRQRDIKDCGAACIASVAAFYNLHLPVSQIRQLASTDKRGTNVLGMLEAVEQLGFEARGVKGTFESLFEIPKPSIAHVVFKDGLYHYVVIYNTTHSHIIIMDPADGCIYKKTHDEFKEEWTGVLVLLVPGESFEKGNRKTSNFNRFWQLVQPHKGMMFQAFFGALVYTLLGLSGSIYVQKLIDFVLVEGNIRLLNLLSVIMIALLFFQLIIGVIKRIFALQTAQNIDAKLILGYYKHLLSLPQRFFDTMKVGEIMSRINDAVKIRVVINEVAVSLVVNTLIIGFSIAIMFLYYWKLAFIIIAIIPFYLAIYRMSRRINRKWGRKLMEDGAELGTHLVESLNAVGTIKRFGLEQYANSKIENRFVSLLRTVYKSSILSVYSGTSLELITRLFTIIILWSGSYFVINHELSPGELLSFYALIGYFTGPASSLITANRSIQDALIAADRLFEIIDLETEESDEHKLTLTPELVDNIQFINVHFRYGTSTQVFKGLDLEIRKGEATAIVGESGSGKSTLLSLFQNLYPLQKGKINIGNIDIKQISNDSLRSMIGIVPQHIDLFAGTIIENIALGDMEPDMKRIIELSHMLGITDFIEKLPNGYHTSLNEQGINLSGGQRQRIAIARALYRNPEILVLDEATSSLDVISEQKVQQALQHFKQQGKTIIIIAHRLSTVCKCDTILVLSHGKLIEMGTHLDLIQLQGHYHQLWQQNSYSLAS
ncbi:peptidase domain-containing ABC transporter [Chitinophagaceae bacterium LB-8]|uniref:Peptidase domain-containing ABC transporter n=1 Tax=Paraflavisolibacter caeni TaxID=2982496 RepID=A0A9X2XNY4_9BACT|nr:peptidase domain-containing ABC transporter [Paraflavisolibacter caeni]MCU7549958.1 peptidase domain-containing ABC transporter [Paraflavisolibacter caeni]